MPGDITGSMVYRQQPRRAVVPRGTGVHQPAAGRRDQPHAAEDAVRAAGGHGGGPGVGRRRDAARCRGRSSWPPRRTRSSTKAPTRCPRRSSTGSCSRSCCRSPTATQELEIVQPARGRLRPAGRRRVRRRAPSPARPTSRPDAGRARGAGLARGRGVRRRRRPRHPPVALAGARRQPARSGRADAHGAGLGLALRARLRDAGRREGARPGDAGPPALPAARGRARGRRRRRTCSPPPSARCPSRAESHTRWPSPDASRCCSCWGWCAVLLRPGGSTVLLWLLVVVAAGRSRRAAGRVAEGAARRARVTRPGARGPRGQPTSSRFAQPRRVAGRRSWSATPGSRPREHATTGTGSGSAAGEHVALSQRARSPSGAASSRRTA